VKESEYRASRLLRELGVPIRYQIAKLLEDGPMTVGQISAALDRSRTTISHHLHILRAVDVVRYETKGRNVVYQLKASLVPGLLALAERCVSKLQIKVR
jgi:DNA-binding transcriptional ArsR family regulator